MLQPMTGAVWEAMSLLSLSDENSCVKSMNIISAYFLTIDG
jgi:hypothetical protein